MCRQEGRNIRFTPHSLHCFVGVFLNYKTRLFAEDGERKWRRKPELSIKVLRYPHVGQGEPPLRVESGASGDTL